MYMHREKQTRHNSNQKIGSLLIISNVIDTIQQQAILEGECEEVFNHKNLFIVIWQKFKRNWEKQRSSYSHKYIIKK